MVDAKTTNTNAQSSLNIDNNALEQAIEHLYQSKTQINQKMLIDTLLVAKVLVPINLTGKTQLDKDNNLIVDKDAKVSLLLLQDNENHAYCPVFTNTTELAKYGDKRSGTLKQGFVTIARTILNADQSITGLVINPFGTSVTLTKAELANLISKETEKQEVKGYKITQGTKVMVGNPNVYPEKMVAVMKAVFENHACVQRAWLRMLDRGDNHISYFIVIDSTDSDLTHLYTDLGRLCEPFANQYPLDFAQYRHKNSFIVAAVKDCEPFFARKRKKFLGIF